MSFYESNENSITNSNEENSNSITIYDKEFWSKQTKETIMKTDTLKLAYMIKVKGYPEENELRVAILNRFNTTDDKEYKIEYEKLCNISDSFYESYPMDKILYLIQENITNTNNYTVDIAKSNMSEEEKALLYFVLPL